MKVDTHCVFHVLSHEFDEKRASLCTQTLSLLTNVAPTLRESKGRRPKNRLLKQRHSFDSPRNRGVGTPSGQGR